MAKGSVAQPVDNISQTIQELWKHVEPYAGPAWHQAQHALKPLMDNLPPVVTDTIAKANKELHGHEPLTVIITTALGSLLLFRLLGLMKRLTAVLMFGLGAAYLWPYAAEHLFKK
ncbi:hypothetical protein CVIRNUC_004964 [Coccomyxa viridis]|uniref:MICOS complex subunit n=1 Tax=Coccomyxa viridis TaxID=1274662 RepID=A0AAV1I363_9CHLO|nr:hypothetical protein CVIRNUC_004964 [Coccomyxa viridis]